MEQRRREPDAARTGSTVGLDSANVRFERLGAHLGQWVGADGWHALLERALPAATAVEPRLAGVALDSHDRLCWFPNDRSPAPPPPEAFEPLLTAVIDVLGRIVGSDMAIHLVELGLREQSDV